MSLSGTGSESAEAQASLRRAEARALVSPEAHAHALAIAALASSKCLAFDYDGSPCLVEVHIVGMAAAGAVALRGYQLVGGPAVRSPCWREFSLARCTHMRVTDTVSRAPRTEHESGASRFVRIDASL